MGRAESELRLPDWESRFAAVLQEAIGRAYHPVEWNCALFTRACVEAITGLDLPRELRGSLIETVDCLFPRIRRSLARPGDVVLASIPAATLGVCTGRYAAFLGESGLQSIPMSEVSLAWRV
jgi:Domain of unknown function (DUF6950)